MDGDLRRPTAPPRKDDTHVFRYFLNSNQYSVQVIIYSSFLVHRVIRPSSATPNVRQAMRVNHEQARMNVSQGRRADR